MAETWRSRPGQILTGYLVLDVAALAWFVTQSHPLPGAVMPPLLPLAAFLAWRVSRGGRLARGFLLALTLLSFGGATFTASSSWHPAILGLLAIYAAQLVLLMSPALYLHTIGHPLPRRSPDGLRSAAPPAWLILSALLAGVVAMLFSLANMAWLPVPGCGPAGAALAELPGRCIGLAQGYPLRFLTASGSTPRVDPAALLTDWVQWSLVSCTVLYLLWQMNRRHELPVPERQAAPA
jgi:hypothetical protein